MRGTSYFTGAASSTILIKKTAPAERDVRLELIYRTEDRAGCEHGPRKLNFVWRDSYVYAADLGRVERQAEVVPDRDLERLKTEIITNPSVSQNGLENTLGKTGRTRSTALVV